MESPMAANEKDDDLEEAKPSKKKKFLMHWSWKNSAL